MSKFIAGLLLGLAALVVTQPSVQELYLGPPAVLWVDYGTSIRVTYFNTMAKCDAAHEQLVGALDSACLRAETIKSPQDLGGK